MATTISERAMSHLQILSDQQCQTHKKKLFKIENIELGNVWHS